MLLGHDIKTKQPVDVSLDRSRVIFVTGKRGSGKSHTLGVLAEQLFLLGLDAPVENRPLILLVDPLGIFFTFCCPNPDLTDGEASPMSLPVRLLVPGDPLKRYGADVVERMETLGVQFVALRLNPSGLSPSEWCELFELPVNEPLGIAQFRAVQHLGPNFFNLDQLMERVWEDTRSQDKTKEALVNRLEMVKGWDIFSESQADLEELLDAHSLNVLDLSVLSPGAYGLGNLIVSLVARDLFQKRVRAKRRENLGLIDTTQRIWLLMDEAHRFVPAGRSTLAKAIVLAWAKEGRQPGLSIVLATQQPPAADTDVVSQCDLLLSHKVNNLEDIAALNRLSQAYLGNELKVYLRQVKHPGEALMVDDFTERLSILTIRPRLTLHGGGESRLPLFQ